MGAIPPGSRLARQGDAHCHDVDGAPGNRSCLGPVRKLTTKISPNEQVSGGVVAFIPATELDAANGEPVHTL